MFNSVQNITFGGDLVFIFGYKEGTIQHSRKVQDITSPYIEIVEALAGEQHHGCGAGSHRELQALLVRNHPELVVGRDGRGGECIPITWWWREISVNCGYKFVGPVLAHTGQSIGCNCDFVKTGPANVLEYICYYNL